MISEGKSPTSTFHEYINEAIHSIAMGLRIQILNDPDIKDGEYVLYRDSIYEINYRYAFLMIANSIEAAANAVMLALGANKEDYQNLEKLNGILKFKIFCDIKGVIFDSDNSIVKVIREINTCRNNFVHPKPKLTELRSILSPTNLSIRFRKCH